MEFIADQTDGHYLLPADRDRLRIKIVVDAARHTQPGLRGGGTDQLHNDLMADQRFAAPVLRDEVEQPMLDPAPLADARPLPQPRSRTIAAAAVGRDQQALRLRVLCPAQFLPPARRILSTANAAVS
jgi:hypothetical protein